MRVYRSISKWYQNNESVMNCLILDMKILNRNNIIEGH